VSTRSMFSTLGANMAPSWPDALHLRTLKQTQQLLKLVHYHVFHQLLLEPYLSQVVDRETLPLVPELSVGKRDACNWDQGLTFLSISLMVCRTLSGTSYGEKICVYSKMPPVWRS
jgi:hypothetical protein